MRTLEDRLRRDLPDLADAMIAQHDDVSRSGTDSLLGSAPADGLAPLASSTVLLEDPPHQQHERRWTPLLAAAVVFVVISLGITIAVNTIHSDGDAGETASVVAAQREDAGFDSVAETRRDQEHRASLIADPPQTLDEALVRWATEGPDDYQYQLSVIRSGRTIALDIEVAGFEARRLEPPPMPAGFEPPAIDQQWITTVEGLFELVVEAAATLKPTFDPELGYPTAFMLDPDDTKVGDELTFRVDELASTAEVESAERLLSDWLPEPSPVPEGLVDLGVLDAEIELYLLHDAGNMLVGLTRQQRDVCLVMITRERSSDQFTGLSQTACTSAIKFGDQGLSTRNLLTSDPSFPLVFVAILPASHHGQDWVPEVTTDRDIKLQSTQESLLVLVDGDLHPSSVRIDIACECGDLVYEPRIG